MADPDSTRTCERCEGPIAPRNHPTDSQRYCSVACYNAAQSRKVERVCDACGARFLVPPSRATARYCKARCRVAPEHRDSWDKGLRRTCEQCGAGFKVSPKRADARFCSRTCADRGQVGQFAGERNPRWKGGARVARRLLTNTGDYKRWRAAVLERDGHTCQRCGARRPARLHAHHRVPVVSDPSRIFDVSNGLTLCIPCHAAEHKALGVPANDGRIVEYLAAHGISPASVLDTMRPRACAVCSRDYSPRAGSQKYCSRRCYQTAKRRRSRARVI
jgi:hypothetical protein